MVIVLKKEFCVYCHLIHVRIVKLYLSSAAVLGVHCRISVTFGKLGGGGGCRSVEKVDIHNDRVKSVCFYCFSSHISYFFSNCIICKFFLFVAGGGYIIQIYDLLETTYRL